MVIVIFRMPAHPSFHTVNRIHALLRKNIFFWTKRILKSRAPISSLALRTHRGFAAGTIDPATTDRLWKARQAAYRVKLDLTGEEADLTTSSFTDCEASLDVGSYELFDPAGEDAGDHASRFGRFHGGDAPGGSWAVL